MNYKLYLIIWPNPRAGKMKQILWADWLPERTKRMAYLGTTDQTSPRGPLQKKKISNNANAYAPDSMNYNRWCFMLVGKLPSDESSL